MDLIHVPGDAKLHPAPWRLRPATIGELDARSDGRGIVRDREAVTEGSDLLEVDLFVSPGAYVRQHVHPAQEETFTGVAGTFELEVDGERRTIRPGDSVVISARTSHGFEPAAGEAHLLVTVPPALELGGYFRAFLTLVA